MKKKNRIRKSAEFQELIHGRRKFSDPCFVLYCAPKKLAQARVGISLSKKIGIAVERNRIKRQVRMMAQDLIDFVSFPDDLIIIVRFGYRSQSFADSKKSLEKLLNKVTIG